MKIVRARESRARLRVRLASRMRADAGDTLIEVLIAALLVAMIAAATFTGYSAVAHVAGGEKQRAQASSLAEADQARLHGLTLNNLSSSGTGLGVGNTHYSQQVNGTVYTVTSTAAFVAASGAASCTPSGASTADEVQILSTVVWTSDAAAGGPVEIHGLVTPQEGGSLIARVLSTSGNPVAGATVSLSGGPTSAATLTTDANGCVEFAALSGGTYTVTATASGVTESVTAPTVVPTQTSVATLTPGGDGSISATFTTSYNGSSHASSADQVTAWNPAVTPAYGVFGSSSTLTANTYQPTVNSGSVFAPGPYTAYGGSCSGDYSNSGYAVANVTTGTTQSVSLPLPAMIVDVWGATPNVETDDPASSSVVYTGSGWTHATGAGATNQYLNTDSYTSTTGAYVTFTFTGTSIQWIGPKATNQGYANVLIDGTQFATDVSTYGPTSFQNVLFSATGLSNATHTIEIYVVGTGTEPPGSSGASVDIDAFIVGSGGSGEVDDPASAAVAYTGSGWTHGATGSNNYDSTESFDLTAGDTVSFTFTGTSVEWIAPVSSNGGYVNIYLDGSSTPVATNVTTYSATTYYQQVVWSDAGLANATHTIKIVVQGTKPAASSNTYAQVDAFIYGTQATSLLAVAPVVTLTDNNAGCSSAENYPATQVPTSTQGALVDPGQPYGNFTACASSGGYENTASVANTSYSAGNVVNLYLNPGAAGLQSGSCT
ncbi:MAG: carboxypeptidase regulatory-like domain-containing protein [Solirubrobacteraceae bacterium]|jgi:Tfp pilus assembly protein PilE